MKEAHRVALLALVAGYVDAHALITHGAYVSFMSGNTTLAGGALGRGLLVKALPSSIAIAGFVAGGFAGTLLAGTHAGPRRACALVAALLSVVLALEHVGVGGLGVIAVLSLAMGIMNSLVTHVGPQSVHIAFVTGTLASMTRLLALAVRGDGAPRIHLARARLLAGMWCAFLVGAVLGGAATVWIRSWTLVPTVVVLLGMMRERFADGRLEEHAPNEEH